jgi:PII-like signaling protein
MSEDDRYQDERLYKVIVGMAQDMHVAGVTVLRGFEGYGASNNIHSQQNIRNSEDLPIVVNVIDKRERLDSFISKVEVMMDDAGAHGLISISPSEMIHPRSPSKVNNR